MAAIFLRFQRVCISNISTEILRQTTAKNRSTHLVAIAVIQTKIDYVIPQ